MATTEYGLNHPLAVKLWSKDLYEEALKETYFGKFMGTGTDSMITKKTELSKGAGDRIRVGLRVQLTGAGILGDSTLEGNEEALVTYSDDIYIDQLRHAVRSSGKMSEQRVPFSVRNEAKAALKDWWADRLDTAMFNQLTGNTAVTDVRYTGNQSAIAPTAASATQRIIVANSDLNLEASLSATASANFSLKLIDRAVALAKTTSPLIRPVMVKGNPMYMCFIHPFQTYQLRSSTSTGQWQDIQKAAITGGQISENPIFTGALGVYNNTILHESTRLPLVTTVGTGAGANGRRAVFCGAQAATVAVGQDNSETKMSWNEQLFDYDNQLGVKAGMIVGVKKNVFNSVDFGTIVISTYAPDPASTP
jgi:N4-gp56 family major capsid protein